MPSWAVGLFNLASMDCIDLDSCYYLGRRNYLPMAREL